MKFSFWNETIEAFPDLPDPASVDFNSAQGYPLFRIRADSELEPVIVSGMQSKARLRSLRSRDAINAVFLNSSDHEAQLVWLNYGGNEVAYDRIPPGTLCRISTFRTHPWIVRDVNSKQRMNVQHQQVVYCEDGPPVQIARPLIEHFLIISSPPLVECGAQVAYYGSTIYER
ncbi:hypothetical protein WJX75_005256 [Coccomyxa subellipsoidea]|uniref:von Hippel-Lindau disease tumour suppressor beta domain-containing protein n=1 Tax=Coccomyxa subellipsoidea TaxID=248742 RepID=A0ABR2YZY8_9CHLO